jgi:hypothetical protein
LSNLYQNYPTPFNPTATISYSLPHTTVVTLKVYDIMDREVVILIKKKTEMPGFHEISSDAKNLPSGFYFYKLYAGNFSNTKKMLLIK